MADSQSLYMRGLQRKEMSVVRFLVYYEGEHVHDSEIVAITADRQIVDDFRDMIDDGSPEPPDEPSRLHAVSNVEAIEAA